MFSDHVESTSGAAARASEAADHYVVVARRYRPQSFEELVGQNQIAHALKNAIATRRVGHAYLFTGARGVGKTSSARILAKCLNCVHGPTATPCGQCDPCLSIASGDDVDVLEIDGASNRGIDEIRQLRSNVNVRPSRSHFKVYIIDEVHMLTSAAFNALLKTLEEPPEHVKFVFCTTDPDKIPITVLSRCQRFDFAPVATEAIAARLRHIVDTEEVEAEDAALQLLARRAGGSMRDSQSLLEQLLSFCGDRLTEQAVHTMLGTAQGGRLSAIGAQLIRRDAAGALGEIDAAVGDGVDVGQLAEQLLAYFRDMMAAGVGCPAEMMLQTAAADYPQLVEAGRQMGLESLLAAIQILDHSITKMRQSPYVRALVEVAVVRICHLEQLDDLSAWIAQLQGGGATAAPAASSAAPIAQKKTPPVTARPSEEPQQTPAPPPCRGAPPAQRADQRKPQQQSKAAAAPSSDGPFDGDTALAERQWQQALQTIGGMTQDIGSDYQSIAISAPNLLAVTFKAAYNKEWCERSDVRRKIEQTLAELAGQAVRLEFAVLETPGQAAPQRRAPAQDRAEKMRQVQEHPLIQETIRLFEAEVIRLQEP